MEIVKSVFQSKGKRYQFIRYCTVGTLAAGIHYGVYYLLQEYEMTNLNIAYTIGYVTSFICNFFCHIVRLHLIAKKSIACSRAFLKSSAYKR